MFSVNQFAMKVKGVGIIAIFRGRYSAARVLELSDVLVSNGVEVVEITMNTSEALDSVERLCSYWGNKAYIGAGTVRTVADADAALRAGAQFLVSPHVDADIALLAAEREVLYLPGALTPTEVQRAISVGCKLVKLFPASAFGPAYLKALRAPLDDVDFVPTGGVSKANLAEYVKAGAAAVGLGGALLTGPDQSASDLAERTKAVTAALREVRGEYGR